MHCTHCGQPLASESRFCERCGAAVEGSRLAQGGEAASRDAEAAHDQATRLVSPGITLGADGAMRWVYELNMWRNPTVLITVWKVLMLSALLPALLVGFLRLVDGDGAGAAVGSFLQIGALVAVIVTALMLLAYPLVALINGGRYCVIFEMDQTGIRHIHLRRQFRRNQALAMLTVLAGALSGSAQTAGAGLLAATRRSLYTAFSDVRAVESVPHRQVIHLATRLSRNQVYAAPADFDFVLRHIAAHCKPAVRRSIANTLG